MKTKIGLSMLLALILQYGTGCTILREFPRRSELTLKARAVNPITDKQGERSTEATLELKGNNRDILQAYKTAIEFTLEKFNLNK